ncbi:uncharacterized protein C8Q71DRAFT_395696 [Rhodofomes roseus]|uniref:Uncharacterized protein n=1 Tax=Rhodofomes roseus TaxID=34475 RepID=A0ABQ8JZB4_9APHY|nr:uncharacterized protein C8Q71DRAFT_395696 [Rhodofomes roseus]KAH9829641.1 hypothetical protein C8Q71DRAFT_395696 [Rhodofomes roseus]
MSSRRSLLRHSFTYILLGHHLMLLLFLVGIPRIVQAGATNRTIDDQYGDSVTKALPKYGNPPSADWNYGPNCSSCSLTPDPDKMFRNSWHDNTMSASASSANTISVSFNGTAVWVYCVTSQKANSTAMITGTNIQFELDGEKVNSPYDYASTNQQATTSDFNYNVVVYSNKLLANKEHTLVMTMQPSSWIAFDWLQYTYVDSVDVVSATSHTSSTASTSSSTTNMPSTIPFTGSSIGEGSSTPPASDSMDPSGTSSLTAGFTTVTTVSGLATTVVSSVLLTSPAPTTSTSVAADTPSSHHPSIAIILGAVAGGLAALVLLSIIVYACRNHKSKNMDGDPQSLSRGSVYPLLKEDRGYLATDEPSAATASIYSSASHRTDLLSLDNVVEPVSRASLSLPGNRYGSDDFLLVSPGLTSFANGHSNGSSARPLPVPPITGPDSYGPEVSRVSLGGYSAAIPAAHVGGYASPTRAGTATDDSHYLRLAFQRIVGSSNAMSPLGDPEVPYIPRVTSPASEHDVAELQRQLGALQIQVDNIRADHVSLGAKTPPPAYEEADDK